MGTNSGEISGELLNAAWVSLRKSRPDASDSEICDLIRAARADLILGGVAPGKVFNDRDPLIRRAIMCYLKAEYGLDNPDSEKYRESYNLVKRSMQLSDDYLGKE